jgi:ribosomal protein S18 acetylase RimI-like enzyme
VLISVSEKAEKAEKSLSFAKTHASRFRVRRAMSSFRGAFVRNVRLDGDDAETRDSPSTVNSETAKLLERLVEIDDACFPSDAGGVASARSWASSPRLRRATRLVAAYDDEVEPDLNPGFLPSSAARSKRSENPEDPSRLAAFASYTASSMCFEITKVACDPSRRRRGHARRLVAAILNEARRRNVKRVALRVEIANRAAVALYESAGFVEDTSRKRAHEGYYGAGRHGTVYERLF